VPDTVGPAVQSLSKSIEVLPWELLRGAAEQRVQNPREELARLLSVAALRGQIGNGDREFASQIVSTETNVSLEEARKRIDAVIERGQQVVESARKTAIVLAFLIGAISVIAAGAAYWGAVAGGRLRDHDVR